MSMTTETENLLIRVYASGMVSGIVTHLVQELPTSDIPASELTDLMMADATQRVRRFMHDPVVRQQVLDMIEAGAPAGVLLHMGGGQ